MELIYKPTESDCCNSGCNPCILDVYEEQIKKFQKKQLEKETLLTNCFKKTEYSVFKVKSIQIHAADALIITFEFSRFLKSTHSKEKDYGVYYAPGQYVMLKMGSINEEIQRSYTPIPLENLNSLQFAILFKLYELGNMSQRIKKLKIDSDTIWRGPYGDFSLDYSYKHILLIAQGVGIAPLYSIISKLTKNEECETFIKLFYCCKSYERIYLRNELYMLQSHWNFTYEIFLSNYDNVSVKYNEIINQKKLDKNTLSNYLNEISEHTQVLICGSNKFMSHFKETVAGLIKTTNIVTF